MLTTRVSAILLLEINILNGIDKLFMIPQEKMTVKMHVGGVG